MLISYRYALYFIQDTDFYREVLPLFKHNLIENYLRLKHLKIENCTLSLETRSIQLLRFDSVKSKMYVNKRDVISLN